ncbi:hypothetical protein C8A03DRAFT_36177 [Achaetomium macrosporum]|uniref:G domain-containing protein n=1 Tax=Achaetomium macrosporum TaxID=79813 RepID=A0AAN7C659_9PEZI|nr:hypothetical protein C8A03DRAFT_36177 [Achaetomium macrosporum]
MTLSTMVLTKPALGEDVQLGMLHDVRSGQFFAGLSLWDNNVINAKQQVEVQQVQDADFTYTTSLDDARVWADLDLEGCLNLDLGITKATGWAMYLKDNKTNIYEARIDVSCRVARRMRRIPQETLSLMQHQRNLDDPRFTHFVAEVVEGGSATLTFVQSCSSEEEAKTVTSRLKTDIASFLVGTGTSFNVASQSETDAENLKISYSGAMAEEVIDMEHARVIAREMPTKLGRQLNTLSYTLLPISVLESSVRREVRAIDANLVAKAAAVLRAGSTAWTTLTDLAEKDVFRISFPTIEKQVRNFQAAFAEAKTEFTASARRLLPELRDGTVDYNTTSSELLAAAALFEQRTKLAEQFIAKKLTEEFVLGETVASLLNDGFENHLGAFTTTSLAKTEAPRLLLSFGGASISRYQHPLQKELASTRLDSARSGSFDTRRSTADSEDDEDDEDDEVEDEWFENQRTVANVREACAALRQQRLFAPPSVSFGVSSIEKAYRPVAGSGKMKRVKTTPGDIVLQQDGRLLIVTSLLPTAPAAPKLAIKDQVLTATWSRERSEAEELAIPTSGFTIRFRPLPNTLKDGAFPRATPNEAFTEVLCDAETATVVIDKSNNGGVSLLDDCDYEVTLCVETLVGSSAPSKCAVGRTLRLPSVASRMIDFYFNNRERLSFRRRGAVPWELYRTGGKNSLFLGLSVKVERRSTEERFFDELAVRIVDVAAEFEPEIEAALTQDQDNTIVVVFAGTSGHGKSTEINAFISYLLGGEVDDPVRLMVIDDRGANQAQAVTQCVTCYRIRPLSPLFEGKTLLIVDTPGYGDTRGVERDAFVTAAMSEFFKTIGHVNAIIFTCRANEVRTTVLSPVSTYVFSLFAKDVQGCLRTIYTFSDAGAPLARAALQELQWPVQNGEVEVNNAAFTIEIDNQNFGKLRDWWLMSVKGQYQVMQMLLRMPPVQTAQSAAVTKTRLTLEQKCEMVEKKILRTANDAQNLIARLGALANAVGAAPGDKILVIQDKSVEKPVPGGSATTLCLDCNWTCHKICVYSDNEEKKFCTAMTGDKCGQCKGRCHWTRHKNAQHIIVVEQYSEWVVPEELIKLWNTNNNTLEGALLNAIDTYLALQEELRDDILFLAQITETLKSTALLHDPTALLGYIQTLILTARARGAPPEQLLQLTTAKNTLLLVLEVRKRGVQASVQSQVLLQVLSAVRQEMHRRMELQPRERASEEAKSCSLYNDLRKHLPPEIQRKAPDPLKVKRVKWMGRSIAGALYPENLQAVVKLVQVVLEDGGVVAALAAAN